MINSLKLVSPTLVGSAGSATATFSSPIPINGNIRAVHIDFTSAPATTDVEIRTKGTPSMPILKTTDINADGWYFPRAAISTILGAAALYAATFPTLDLIPVNDHVEVVVSQGDPAIASEVVITILYEDDQ